MCSFVFNICVFSCFFVNGEVVFVSSFEMFRATVYFAVCISLGVCFSVWLSFFLLFWLFILGVSPLDLF